MDATERRRLRALVSQAQYRSYQRAERMERALDQHIRLLIATGREPYMEEVLVVPSKGGEVTELIGFIRKAGYKVVRSGSQKHYKIQNAKGAIVTDSNGPLIISTSPSEHRWREMHVQRLMRAGVLKQDPYKATGKQSRGPQTNGSNGDGGEPEEEPKKKKGPDDAAREKAREAMARNSRSRNAAAMEATAKLRSRFEPIVPHLGGWAQGAGPRSHLSLTALRVLTVSELANVMHRWAVARGRLELPKDRVTKTEATAVEVQAAAKGLKTGGTISEKWQPLVEVFLDDLWRDAGNDPKKAAARYLVLLREQMGIVADPESPRPGEPLIDEPRRIEPPRKGFETAKVGPAFAPKPSRLAFETLYLLAKNGEEEGRAIDMAMQIAELEMQRQEEGA